MTSTRCDECGYFSGTHRFWCKSQFGQPNAKTIAEVRRGKPVEWLSSTALDTMMRKVPNYLKRHPMVVPMPNGSFGISWTETDDGIEINHISSNRPPFSRGTRETDEQLRARVWAGIKSQLTSLMEIDNNTNAYHGNDLDDLARFYKVQPRRAPLTDGEVRKLIADRCNVWRGDGDDPCRVAGYETATGAALDALAASLGLRGVE